VVAFGVADGPIRLEGVEAALVGGAASAEEAQIAVASAAAALDPPDDIHATARFRRELTAELTRVAIADAWGRIA
jgi:carbon-monoxide dehydrogenase medium subunit